MFTEHLCAATQLLQLYHCEQAICESVLFLFNALFLLSSPQPPKLFPMRDTSLMNLWRNQNFDALLFDCDGTLADTMPAHYRAWLTVCEAHGMTFDEDRFYALGGRPTRDIVATLAAEFGVTLNLEEAVIIKEQSFLLQLDSIQPIDPVVDVVNRSRGKIPMAVATGGTREVCTRILEHIGIADAFSALVASEDVVRHKPDPDVFLEAAKRVGARPKHCVVWEDSDLGIEAARRAGMAWVDVRPFHSPTRVSKRL